MTYGCPAKFEFFTVFGAVLGSQEIRWGGSEDIEHFTLFGVGFLKVSHQVMNLNI